MRAAVAVFAGALASSPASVLTSHSRPLVLYVDDDESNRTVLVRYLGHLFEIETVSSPLEALQRVYAGGVDIIVTDQRMPEMLGLDLLERVHKHYPTLPAIVVSAYLNDGDIKRGLDEHRASHFFVKPFKMNELAEAIWEALAPDFNVSDEETSYVNNACEESDRILDEIQTVTRG